MPARQPIKMRYFDEVQIRAHEPFAPLLDQITRDEVAVNFDERGRPLFRRTTPWRDFISKEHFYYHSPLIASAIVNLVKSTKMIGAVGLGIEAFFASLIKSILLTLGTVGIMGGRFIELEIRTLGNILSRLICILGGAEYNILSEKSFLYQEVNGKTGAWAESMLGSMLDFQDNHPGFFPRFAAQVGLLIINDLILGQLAILQHVLKPALLYAPRLTTLWITEFSHSFNYFLAGAAHLLYSLTDAVFVLEHSLLSAITRPLITEARLLSLTDGVPDRRETLYGKRLDSQGGAETEGEPVRTQVDASRWSHKVDHRFESFLHPREAVEQKAEVDLRRQDRNRYQNVVEPQKPYIAPTRLQRLSAWLKESHASIISPSYKGLKLAKLMNENNVDLKEPFQPTAGFNEAGDLNSIDVLSTNQIKYEFRGLTCLLYSLWTHQLKNTIWNGIGNLFKLGYAALSSAVTLAVYSTLYTAIRFIEMQWKIIVRAFLSEFVKGLANVVIYPYRWLTDEKDVFENRLITRSLLHSVTPQNVIDTSKEESVLDFLHRDDARRLGRMVRAFDRKIDNIDSYWHYMPTVFSAVIKLFLAEVACLQIIVGRNLFMCYEALRLVGAHLTSNLHLAFDAVAALLLIEAPSVLAVIPALFSFFIRPLRAGFIQWIENVDNPTKLHVDDEGYLISEDHYRLGQDGHRIDESGQRVDEDGDRINKYGYLEDGNEEYVAEKGVPMPRVSNPSVSWAGKLHQAMDGMVNNNQVATKLSKFNLVKRISAGCGIEAAQTEPLLERDVPLTPGTPGLVAPGA